MGEQVPRETRASGWTRQERGLAATAGALALAIVVLIGVAIAGRTPESDVGSAPGSSPGNSPTALPTALPSPESPSPTASPSVPATEAGRIDFAGLADVRAYRFRMELEGSGANSPLTPIDGLIAVDGTVTTDPEAVDLSMSNILGPGTVMRIVAIGEEAWTDVGEGMTPYRGDPDSIEELIETYQPDAFFAQFVGELPSDAIMVEPRDGVETTRNGVAVTEYELALSTMDVAGRTIGLSGSFAIDNGRKVPVFFEVTLTDPADASAFYRVSISLIDLDDPDVTVVRP